MQEMKNSGVIFVLRNTLSAIFTPGYGTCLRCGGFWNVVPKHTTSYGMNGSGCFPLCETCWTELGSPEARMPYYDRLVSMWSYVPGLEAKHLQIRAAVMADG
jgi:hypothetical protein